MRYATVADVVTAMTRPRVRCPGFSCVSDPCVCPPLTETQAVPASNRDAARELVARMERKREREHQADYFRQTATQLHDLIFEGIRVLRTRDGLPVTDDAARERTNNLVTSIMGNLDVRLLP